MKIEKNLKDVLILLSQGKSNREIAFTLNFSEIYVKKIVSQLLGLYKVRNRVELANEYNAEKMLNI